MRKYESVPARHRVFSGNLGASDQPVREQIRQDGGKELPVLLSPCFVDPYHSESKQ